MRFFLGILALSFLTCPVVSQADDNVSPEAALMKAASSNFAVACLNLTRDVQEKRLTIYSVSRSFKSQVVDQDGFAIRVVYHPALAQNYAGSAGSYQQHYNACLLDFALAQFGEGKKALAIRLVQLLAEAEPKLSWSSMRIEPTTIKQILAGLQSNESSLSSLIEEASRDWRQREKDYRP